MYTSQKSIEAKVGNVTGWKDLLMSVGFRFEPEANKIPAAVFFPQSDPGERLTQCSASLQALLGLSPTSWGSLSCLLSSPDSADEIMAMFRLAIGQFGPHSLDVESVVMPVGVRLWRIPGCHELLASLGFDLMEVGRDEVTLKTGKTANKRQIQFALQALVALFDTDAAPRCLEIESSECSEEQEDPEEGEERDVSAQRADEERTSLPSFPAPRKSSLVLDGSSGAFSSYARNRGEPDGRQHPDSPPAQSASPKLLQTSPPPPAPPQGMSYHPKGRESDCNFTPSPVDRLSASTRYFHNQLRKLSHIYSLQISWLYPNGLTHLTTAPKLDRGVLRGETQRTASWTSRTIPTVSPREQVMTMISAPMLPIQYSYCPTRFEIHNVHPCRSSTQSSHHTADWEAGGQATVLRRTNAPHSKLSPGVTEQGVGMDFRKYLLATSSSLYETAEATPTATPVRSVFAEAGFHSKAKLLEQNAPNDKLSIRAELTKSGSTSGRRSRESLGRSEGSSSARLPPTGGSSSPRRGTTPSQSLSPSRAEGVMVRDSATPSIQETIISSQMRRINRELPISEVYHERSLGLGLAPPLSKLIMSNNIAVAQVDHHQDSVSNQATDSMSNFDNLSVIEEAHPSSSKRGPRPPVPPKPEPWVSAGLIQADLRSPPNSNSSSLARDEGDGRSMTDSQYSGCSPSTAGTNGVKDLNPKFAGMKMAQAQERGKEDKVRREVERREVERREAATVIASPVIRPADLSHYINSEFHSKREKSNKGDVARDGLGNNLELGSGKREIGGKERVGQAQHPHMWDRNGRFTYTGQFSSDC